jgi:hypothetical protein
MNLETLCQKLIATARANPPSEATPYAFEQRIMARLSERPAEDAWLRWGRGLWRAAGACAAIAVLFAGLSFIRLGGNGAPDAQAEDVESVVFAAAEQLSDSW